MHPGQHLAERYVVGERIGGGGMADVFRGHDLWLRREVAIKVIKHGMASPEMCARMLQEGRAAAAIDHPHLLRVLDIGRIHASVYLITDLLHGRSLAEHLRGSRDARLDWQEAIELLLPALDAIQRVHDHGYIHRDLKPDNLFVHHRDYEEALIVLDLGIAKIAPALRGEGAPVPTETGRLLGTPAYMSPEQASSLPLDHRTDIYSIGVTLHRMLAGRLPFEPGPGDTPYALMARHIYDTPPRVDHGCPDIPAALADIVLRTLAKAPAQRPQSMRDLASALRDCLPAPIVAIETPTQTLDRKRRVYHHKSLAGVIAVAALMFFQGPPANTAATTPTLPDPLPDEPTPYIRTPIRIPAASAEITAIPARLAPEEAPPAPPPARSPAALARVLAAAAGPIAGCIREHGDLDTRAITVTLTLRPAGQVAHADLVDRDETTLGRCVRPLLTRLRFPAGPAQHIQHTFDRSPR
ncbi:MAG TPA: serine/threonine-protein kinase [Nannocystis sp.]